MILKLWCKGTNKRECYNGINAEPLTTYRYFTGVNYEGLTGAYLNVMPNPGLMWEQKKDYNFGFDFRAFGLSLTFDIYKADTKNMLTNVSIPTSTGFNTVKDNLGLVRTILR